MQRLASAMDFGTTARLRPRKNLLALALMTAGKQGSLLPWNWKGTVATRSRTAALISANGVLGVS